jgi:hypothetical protein
MSQPKIKKKNVAGPLDWIRTDDRSMVEYFYIVLMTRGLYGVMAALTEACGIEAQASREQKAEFHPGWIQNAEFCEEAISRIKEAAATLHAHWDNLEDPPNTSRDKQAMVGGMYPLPGGGLYVPKRPPKRQ